MKKNKFLDFLYFLIFLIIFFASIISYYFYSKPIELICCEKNTMEKEEVKRVIKPIFRKALFLSEYKFDIDINVLKNEFKINLKENRFDDIISQNIYEIKIKSSEDIFFAKENEKVFLKISENNEFHFSKDKSSTWIILKSLDKDNIRLVLEADIENLKLDKKIYSDSVVISIESKVEIDPINLNNEGLKKLQKAKWQNEDKFYQILENVSIQRLEIEKDFINFKINDLLIYKDGRWQNAKPGEQTENYLIAKIDFLSQNKMRLSAFDIDSSKYIFSYFFEFSSDHLIKSETIKNIKKRTHSHISLVMNNQRLIVKEKDILIKSGNRYKILKKGVLLSELKGEIFFYIDKIFEEGNKSYFIGYFFNGNRDSFSMVKHQIENKTFNRRGIKND
ncbi:MAG: hypothetical protein A3F40_01225 [Chlamydiae bacterium RIFCSPHIGHO2_12_FULL_27_8]|nr:MAG: hypothetical protein A3F40_01225 [Chlamydiae bacterium RIFCSPHIGHO2_12_FULL_27_8]